MRSDPALAAIPRLVLLGLSVGSATLARAGTFYPGPALEQNGFLLPPQGPPLATNAGVFYGNTARDGDFSVAFVWTTDGTAAKPMSDYMIVLPTPGDPPNVSDVRRVDQRSGIAYGQSGTFDPYVGYQQLSPARWSAGTSPVRTVLSDLPGAILDQSAYVPYPTAVNGSGAAVGFTNTNDPNHSGFATRAVRWDADSTAATELLPLAVQAGQYASAQADDINNAGVAVGSSLAYQDGSTTLVAGVPVRWAAGSTTPTALGRPTDFNAYTRQINDAGLIAGVGERETPIGFETRAVRWVPGSNASQTLASFHPDSPTTIHHDQAYDLNERGQIAGDCGIIHQGNYFASGLQAVVWEADGSLRPLPTPSLPADQHSESSAYRINSIGTVIGEVADFQDADSPPYRVRGTVWTPDGQIIDVNTLLPAGWTNCNTLGEITDTGFVTGIAYVDSGQGYPVPRQFAVLVPSAGTYGWGDGDLDGRVNFDDLLLLAKHYNQPNVSRAIDVGDADLNGTTDFSDLLALAKHYNASLPTSSDVAAIAADPAFVADWALAQSLVPEPTLVGLFGAGVAARGRRRR